MSKTSLLARLSGSAPLSHLTPSDLANRRNAAEAALSRAESLHRKAALAVEQQVPGAAAGLIEATENLALANAKVRDVLAAQIEAEAEDAERRRRDQAAYVEKEDRATRAVFAAQAAVAREGEPVIAAFTAWWSRLLDANAACRAEFATNPRLRSDLALLNVADLVGREITRASAHGRIPPGPNVIGATLSDPGTWQSLGSILADQAAAVLPASTKTKGNR